jgi:molecular chaperone HtpG
VKKISGYIMRKVADKLEEIFKKDREGFEKKWDDIKVFIEYGMISEEKFYERAEKFALLKNTEGKYFTLEEYKKHIKETQTDKDKNLVCLYANDTDAQHSFIAGARDRGYDVLILDGVLDNHMVNTLEQKLTDTRFKRVDSDTLDKLIPKEENNVSKLDDKQKEELKTILERNIDKEKFTLVFENQSESDPPLTIIQPEFIRRMKDMAEIGGGYMGLGNMPENYNLIVNTNHKLNTRILAVEDEAKQDNLVKQMYDLALLAQNLLKGESLTQFVHRSIQMINP